MIWGLLTRETIKFLSLGTVPLLSSIPNNYLITMISYITWIFIEGYLMSKFGYTFGKWLLNVCVRDINGNKLIYSLSIKRVIYVWFLGEGLSIPYFNIITNIFAYLSLTNNGITIWDSKLNVEVKHSEIGWRRSIVAIVLIIAIAIIPIITNI